jgi:hypothetical protein
MATLVSASSVLWTTKVVYAFLIFIAAFISTDFFYFTAIIAGGIDFFDNTK